VPLHWRRLIRRRYNQSAELARRLAARSGRPVVVDLLERRSA
jgi:predicted amidophosphoribosyltransferase